ncbi:MAG: GAP family protein [Candidatus Diapherotrites archaeon]
MKKFLITLILIFLSVVAFSEQNEVNAVFFYGKGCPHCANADIFLEEMEQKYDYLSIERKEISENVELVFELYDIYSVPINERGAVPIIFIGEKYILGDSPIINNFESELLSCESEGCKIIKSETENVRRESGGFDLNALIVLAIADAVNPCELAVLIILMTAILSRFPRERKKALKAGLAFSSAIFLMYFVFGLLIISGFKFLGSALNLSNTWFFGALAVLAIVLGLLNLKDAIWYGGGGFIMEVPQKWRPKMKEIINGTTSTKGAFMVGLIVSLFLTPCTAGPYFVATGMLSVFTWVEAMPYFLLYMLIFISPMVAITLLTYTGFAAVEDMGGWRERNLKKLHFLAGAIMLAIGLLMLAWVFGLFNF